MSLQYDEFDDGVIAPFWVVDGAPIEQDGWIGYGNEVGVNYWAEQPIPTGVSIFDVYTKISLPNPTQVGTNATLGVYDWDQELQQQLTYYNGPSGLAWYIRSIRSTLTENEKEIIEVTVTESSFTVWFRIRYEYGVNAVGYYSLIDPLKDSDWIPFGVNTVIVAPPVGENAFFFIGDGWSPGAGQGYSHNYYFRAWPYLTSDMRVRPRHINILKDVPTKVSDMKVGELRLVDNSLFGRVGNQVLSSGIADYIFPTTTTTTTTT